MHDVRVIENVRGMSPLQTCEFVWQFEHSLGRSRDVIAINLSNICDQSSRISSWRVAFRDEEFRWTEKDELDLRIPNICFSIEKGDFDVFEGSWEFYKVDVGTKIEFSLVFDMGIPSLSGIFEPLAGKLVESIVKEAIYKI